MVLLSNKDFLAQLVLLIHNANSKSVPFSLTLKRYDGHDRPKPREGRPPLPLPDEYKCLIRAKASSKKLSTVVSQDDVPKVMEEYSKILKNGMDNLKKVKRNRNKTKAAQGI
ncbi:signal recognition particle 14 kDa protein-like [Sitodiplosis mosellana]|uniref:signal recognition particle 14 kDa protein-like n=1 Tax=Sitodiplosis mosellana TaxID=263140 RepID=UPI00244492D8|nr:signal recognition particle 14 kDa protein-like [Sitodiplosis mosellana]